MELHTTLHFFDVMGDTTARVQMDVHGHLVFEACGATFRGTLSDQAFARIRSNLALLDPKKTGAQVGVGDTTAELTVLGERLLIRMRGFDPKRDDTGWGAMPAPAKAMRVLYRAACALRAGTFASFRPELPEVMPREGLAFRFMHTVRGVQPSGTYAVYTNGDVACWDLDESGWCGRCLGRGVTEVATVAAAVTAAERLFTALSKSRIPHARGGSDPTDHLTVLVAIKGELRAESFSWGRASVNDSPGFPLPPDVPVAFFDDMASAMLGVCTCVIRDR